MDILKILDNPKEQNAGRWFDWAHPITGSDIGLRVLIAGPDSDIQKQARFDLIEATRPKVSRSKLVHVSPAAEYDAMTQFYSTCILAWEFSDAAQSLACKGETKTRLLEAGTWIRAQTDVFCGDRFPYLNDDEEVVELVNNLNEIKDAFENVDKAKQVDTDADTKGQVERDHD